MSAMQYNDAFLAGIRIHDHFLKTRSDNFILVGQQKNRGRMDVSGVANTVELLWNPQRGRTSQQPQIPPAVLAEDQLSKRRRIMQDKAIDASVRSHMKRGCCSNARTKKNYSAICRIMF